MPREHQWTSINEFLGFNKSKHISTPTHNVTNQQTMEIPLKFSLNVKCNHFHCPEMYTHHVTPISYLTLCLKHRIIWYEKTIFICIINYLWNFSFSVSDKTMLKYFLLYLFFAWKFKKAKSWDIPSRVS